MDQGGDMPALRVAQLRPAGKRPRLSDSDVSKKMADRNVRPPMSALQCPPSDETSHCHLNHEEWNVTLRVFVLNSKDMKSIRRYGKKADLALGMWVKLARASATFNLHAVQQIRSFGLTQPQFGVLECLGHLGPMPIGDLSKKMLVSGGNMTCVVDNLAKDGYVERVQSGDDRRSVIVRLTRKGTRLFEDVFVQHADRIAALASVLTEKEQEQLSALLRKLGHGLQEP